MIYMVLAQVMSIYRNFTGYFTR